jgi:tol-pal system protein YbgF
MVAERNLKVPVIAPRFLTSLPLPARLFSLVLSLSCPLSITAGCAHTSEEEMRAKEKAQRQEMDVMKERVRRVERKLSDLDTKMTLLLERSESEAQSSVSSGAPAYPSASQPSYPPAAQRAPRTYAQPSDTAEPAPAAEPDRAPVAVGPGARPIDIPTSEAPVTLDPEPSEPLVVGDEPDGPPIIIDKDALARLERQGTPPVYSRTPNRPVTRDDTRPGPSAAASTTPPKRSSAATGASSSGSSSQKAVNSPMPTRSAKTLYKWAMSRREEGNHAQAIGAFDELQKRWPQHHLADNAIYWMGLCYEQSGADDKALAAWKRLPMRYPKSAKIPDALFGMAAVHERRGDRSTAIALYAQLIDQYPRAERAGDARGALARLRGS